MKRLRHHTGFLNKTRDKDLYYQFWVPEEQPRALILIIHGLTGHSGRYSHFVNHFTQEGYAVFGIDLPGHGRSFGKKVFVKSFDTFRDTLKEAIYRVKRLYPNKPLFVLGHSMGGLITSEYLTHESELIDGAILSCPSIKTTKPISPIKYLLGLFMSFVHPTYHLLKLNTKSCKSLRDSDDPYLYRGKITARLSVELLKAMKRVKQRAKKISTPMLILQCCEDEMVSPAGAQALYRHIQSEDKTFHLYNNESHEILGKSDDNPAFKDLSHWLQNHCDQTTSA